MERQEMIEKIEAGYDPIDLSIEKWNDILLEQLNKKDTSTRTIRDASTCALCEKHITTTADGCLKCPLGKIQLQCEQTNSPYREAIHNNDATIMLKALYKAKEHENKTETNKYGEIKKQRTFKLGDIIRHDKTETLLITKSYNEEKCEYFLQLIDIVNGMNWGLNDKIKYTDNEEITEEMLNTTFTGEMSSIEKIGRYDAKYDLIDEYDEEEKQE